MGRATQGVTLINIDDGDQLSGVRRVVESDADDDGDVPSDASGEQAGGPDQGAAPTDPTGEA